MLVAVKSLKVGQTTSAEAQSLFRKWGRWGEIQTYCREDTCQYFVRIWHILPAVFRADPEEKGRYWLPTVIDRVGLRSAAVGAGFTEERGVVTAKEFWEEVGLPVREWYVRGGAYVSDLVVSADEVSKFRDDEEEIYLRPSHPFRIARNMKGPYGVMVKFKPDEAPAEKAALMDFHFSCITKFSPCHSEREILPEGWQMLDVRY
jgi:hypothetical protein